MKSRLLNLQPDLFANDQPPIQLSAAQKKQMTQLVKSMLIEIVVTAKMPSREAETPAAVETTNEQNNA